MILVIGGTGNISKHVVRRLAEAGRRTRVMARDPQKVQIHSGAVEIVRGDLEQPASVAEALRGAGALLLLAPGPDIPAQDRALIAAAQAAGTVHVVMVSSLGVELGGVGSGEMHQPGEELLRASPLSWTILRGSEYMTNTLWWRGSIASAGAIFVPSGTGRVALVDPADIAAVAAHVLTTPGHIGKTYRLTGPEALTTADIAERLSDVVGTPIRHVDVSVDQFRGSLQQVGMPAFAVDLQTRYYAAMRAGTLAMVTSDVAALLGRPATDYRTWAATNVSAFR